MLADVVLWSRKESGPTGFAAEVKDTSVVPGAQRAAWIDGHAADGIGHQFVGTGRRRRSRNVAFRFQVRPRLRDVARCQLARGEDISPSRVCPIEASDFERTWTTADTECLAGLTRRGSASSVLAMRTRNAWSEVSAVVALRPGRAREAGSDTTDF